MKQVRLLTIFLILMNFTFLCSNLSSAVAKLDLQDLSGFKCYGATKIETPIRITASGQIECFSTDGKVCANYLNNDIKCREFVARNKSQLKSIVCQKGDKKNKSHWCHKAANFFHKKWHCPDETALDLAVKFSRKFGVKCLSKDGKTCLRGAEAMKQCHWVNTCGKKNFKKVFTPLKCKERDFKSGNWCARAFAYFRHTGNFLCNSVTGLEVAVKLSSKGKVECVSKTGKECLKGLKSDFQCLKDIHVLSEGELVCPKTFSCHKGDFVPSTWCEVAYKNLFLPISPKKLEVFKDNTKTIKVHITKEERKGPVKPAWIKIIKNIITSPIVKTLDGQKALVKVLHSFNVKLPKTKIKQLIKAIKNGKIHQPSFFTKIIKRIKEQKAHPEELKLAANPKICYKKNMEKLKKLLTEPKTPTKIHRIIKFLEDKFYVSEEVKKEVKKFVRNVDLKDTKTIKQALRNIRDYVSVRHVKNKEPQKIKLEARCDTKFFKGLRKLFRKGNLKTVAGLKKIRKYFKDHFGMKKALWRKIKKLIKKIGRASCRERV